MAYENKSALAYETFNPALDRDRRLQSVKYWAALPTICEPCGRGPATTWAASTF